MSKPRSAWLYLAGTAALLTPAATAAAQPTPAPAASERSIETLRQQAEAGDPTAQFDLGVRLLDARQASAFAEARRWFERAAAGGNLEAKNAYGGMLLQGAGGARDERRGRRLLEEAATAGSVGANMTLAAAYERGTPPFGRDPGRAFAYTRAAVALAPPPSLPMLQWRLAMLHAQGVGTRTDPQEAWRLVVLSSDSGHPQAMISRAVMLATGEGVSADPAEARRWYERAAATNDRQNAAHAMRALGGMLLLGQGGPVDLPRGYAYLLIAKAGGDRMVDEIIARTARQLTPEVQARGLEIAREWVERNGSAGRRP